MSGVGFCTVIDVSLEKTNFESPEKLATIVLKSLIGNLSTLSIPLEETRISFGPFSNSSQRPSPDRNSKLVPLFN